MPDTLVDADVLRAAVQLACRAPSFAKQTWQWVAEGAGLHLYVDHSRILPSTDKSGREAFISCGAVLDHLCVAMAAAGWTANVDRFPDPHSLDRLASLDFSPLGLVTDYQRRRADAILGSVTNQPTQLSRISRNTVSHHPTTKYQASTDVIQETSGAGRARTDDQRIMSPRL